MDQLSREATKINLMKQSGMDTTKEEEKLIMLFFETMAEGISSGDIEHERKTDCRNCASFLQKKQIKLGYSPVKNLEKLEPYRRELYSFLWEDSEGEKEQYERDYFAVHRKMMECFNKIPGIQRAVPYVYYTNDLVMFDNVSNSDEAVQKIKYISERFNDYILDCLRDPQLSKLKAYKDMCDILHWKYLVYGGIRQ